VKVLHCESSLRVVLCSKTDVSTALLPFYIMNALDGSVRKTFGPASILHCECSLRMVLCSKTEVSTALLLPFYITNALCETTSDLLLLPYYIVNAVYDLLLLLLLLYIYSHLLVST